MALPDDSIASTVSLEVVASWSAENLSSATIQELRTIISRIITSKFYLSTPSKYQLVTLNGTHLRGNNIETMIELFFELCKSPTISNICSSLALS